MNRDQIMGALETLSRSQGSYGRLLDNITEEGIEYLEDQEFKDVVDMIMFLEG